jgi:hypothetical protein
MSLSKEFDTAVLENLKEEKRTLMLWQKVSKKLKKKWWMQRGVELQWTYNCNDFEM